MYNSAIVADRIKSISKLKNVVLKEMFEALEVSDATLTNLRRGSILKADTLARIADYLETTTDYLLGRSDIPDMYVNVSNSPSVSGNNNLVAITAENELEKEISSILSQLSPRQRTELMMTIYQFLDKAKENKQ